MWMKVLLGLFLMLLSVLDLKEKRISGFFLVCGSVLTGILLWFQIRQGSIGWIEIFLGMLPGLFLLAVAWLSKGAGYADGIVLIWLGCLYGYKNGLLFLGSSLFLLALLSIVLLMFRKVKRNSQIPYIPFLTASFLFINLC